jgi:hypothetical protein
MTSNPLRTELVWRCLRVFILASITALAGCSTPYAPTGLTGGFTDKMVSDDTGVIVISGNGFTSPEKVESMLLLRASEMTVQSGHQRFSLLTIEDQAALDAQKAGRLPAYLREKAARDAPKPRLLTEQTTISNRYLTTTVNKSGGGFFVVMYKGNKGGAHDASKLVAELRPKLQAAAAEQPAPAAATVTQ